MDDATVLGVDNLTVTQIISRSYEISLSTLIEAKLSRGSARVRRQLLFPVGSSNCRRSGPNGAGQNRHVSGRARTPRLYGNRPLEAGHQDRLGAPEILYRAFRPHHGDGILSTNVG